MRGSTFIRWVKVPLNLRLGDSYPNFILAREINVGNFVQRIEGTIAINDGNLHDVKAVKDKKMEGVSDFSKLTVAYEEISLFDDKLYSKKSLESSGFNALKEKIVNVFKNPNSSQLEIDEAVSDFTQNFVDILSRLKTRCQ
ncbi:hypothetical protein [Bacillus sp. AFS031507]|uniref:hypothetical protein n=1 Tax=Bacillus sp. AFS031507 TaxID=2033496 RepID=UPI000BFB95FF|nr:hypothetical protein [Bacillus sp. AFS031507]PGY09919.1 hypothetical protein COE25_15945 [Bacillus sp. AFS031507]